MGMGFPIWLRWVEGSGPVAVPRGGWQRGPGGSVIARYADRSELEVGNFVMLALRPLVDAEVLAGVQAELRHRLSQREAEREPPAVL